MTYRQKRHKAGLSVYTMAKQLGLSRQKYLEVDRGERELDGERLEKFNEIIKNAQMINIDRMQNVKIAREWVVSNDFKKKMKEYGYNYVQLAKMLGYVPSTISWARAGKGSDDLMEEIYDFLHDTMNKRKKGNKDLPEKIKDVDVVIDKNPVKVVDIELKTEEEVNNKIKNANEEIKEENLEVHGTPTFMDYNEINKIVAENEKLRRQIYLYEKLIERL